MLLTPIPRQPQQRRPVPPDHAALTTRALSNTNPARPYICRLIVFNRFTCPSTGPLLHVSVTAACTAASSRRMPSANRRRSGLEEASPRVSHSLKVPDERLRIRSANSSAKSNAAVSSVLRARIALSRACSATPRSSGRRAHSKDSCDHAAGCGPTGLVPAGARVSDAYQRHPAGVYESACLWGAYGIQLIRWVPHISRFSRCGVTMPISPLLAQRAREKWGTRCQTLPT